MDKYIPDSMVMTAEPSSGSEDSDCDIDAHLEIDEIINLTWAKDLLADSGVVSPHEVRLQSRAVIFRTLSRVKALTIHYESNGEPQSLPLVVKLPPRDPFGRLFVAEAQFDTREILFYTKLAPVLNQLAEEALGPDSGLPIPKCIKGRIPDEIGGDSELVLEDVTKIGFNATNFAAGLSLEQARSAIYAVARLHALSLALRDREGPLDQRFDFLFPCERAAAGYLRLVKRGLPQLESFLKERKDCVEEASAVTALCSRAPSLLGTLLRPAEPAPLAHADFWSGNLLFREKDGKTDCIALDWQMVSIGRPMDDVALLLLSSLSPELRRSNGESLIEEYGDRLVADCERLGAADTGATVRQGLAADWPRAALRALLLCAGSVDVALGDHRAEHRLVEAVRDLYAQRVLDLKPDTES